MIDLEDLTVFVGRNDAGKSNVLKALDMFFNNSTGKYRFEDNFSLFHKTPERKAKEIKIELTIGIPKHFKDGGDVVWTKTWRANGWHDEKFDRSFSKRCKSRAFLDRIHYEYVPAVKSREYFKELLAKLYRVLLSLSSGDLSKAGGEYTVALRKATSELESIAKENIGIDSYLQIPNDMENLFRDLQIETEESSEKIPLQLRGDDIQARYIPSILKFIYDRNVDDSDKNHAGGVTVWGYEEPENGVEMGACFDFAEEFLRYSKDIQEVITTHSPAFYELESKKGSKVVLYHVRKENGLSKYDSKSPGDETINGEMGVLELLEPYIRKFRTDLEDKTREADEIKAELEKVESYKNGILIYTEGETDAEYIRKAVEKTELKGKCSFQVYGNKDNGNTGGDSELDKLCEAFRKIDDGRIKIFVYDRDKKLYKEPFDKVDKRIYRFNIPVPSHRNHDDRISIEHYFRDEDIKTFDENGRRLFMAGEFMPQGLMYDGRNRYICSYVVKNCRKSDFNDLLILDGKEGREVEIEGVVKNVALPKSKFAKYVAEGHEGFCFDMGEFNKIVDVIREIVDDAEKP